ncbi:protein trichome birefringence-like 34 isoform X2 [Mercurialis annua]|nr:protein trichome birefringence-like 34 isoform X2 [Mercurialis annua]
MEDRTASSGDDLLSGCDLFSGKWVFDNKSYPLYKEKECSFMSDQLACGKFGRQDLGFQNWRWQPHQCDLPRFNATELLERLRNKSLMFVGDSLNRGQWVSMVCLVDSALPSNQKSMHHNGSLATFKAIEYNASIAFYWAPLLVESNSDDPVNHRVDERIVRVQAIEKHARHWIDSDILVFNSYLWWRRSQMKVLWGSFDSPDGVYKFVKMPRVYEMALKTWSDWLEVHIDPSRQQLFFVSMSPTHETAEEWDGVEGENCYNETEQIMKEGYKGKSTCEEMMHVVDKTLDDLKTRGLNVQMINITQLSEYRKEGHPSIYRKQWEPLKEEQILNPKSYADCIHWCLPGIPDVWNELLYAHILNL